MGRVNCIAGLCFPVDLALEEDQSGLHCYGQRHTFENSDFVGLKQSHGSRHITEYISLQDEQIMEANMRVRALVCVVRLRGESQAT